MLVPYYNYEVKTRFLEEGISYDDLSEEDKERYEDDFIEDGQLPDLSPLLPSINLCSTKPPWTSYCKT